MDLADTPTLFNIVDTPGHADFGGEVERVLSMVDGVMLVVDAAEGPMPQTKFVLGKALSKGLPAVVVINKVDKPHARLGEVEDEVLELLMALDADEEQLDAPVIYASAKDGWAASSPDGGEDPNRSIFPLLEQLHKSVPSPSLLGGPDDPFQMLVTQSALDSFLGKLATGKVAAGRVKVGDALKAMTREGELFEEGQVTKVFRRRGLEQIVLDVAEAGDIVQVAGLTKPKPTDTICAPEINEPLHADPIDPPTMSMTFAVNDSPLAGKVCQRPLSTCRALPTQFILFFT